jgi:hypothetical protein
MRERGRAESDLLGRDDPEVVRAARQSGIRVGIALDERLFDPAELVVVAVVEPARVTSRIASV